MKIAAPLLAIMLMLTAASSADTIRFNASGYGIDPTRLNRISGNLAYNPKTNNVSSAALSFQGVLPWERGDLDPDQPWNGTYDGQTLDLTGFAGLLVQHDPGCGPIASLSVSGDIKRGDMQFSLLYPDDVPAGCTLSGHLAEGATSSSTFFETVPEPSAAVLWLIGLLPIWRRWR